MTDLFFKYISAPSCSVKDIFFLHVFERKMLHTRGAVVDVNYKINTLFFIKLKSDNGGKNEKIHNKFNYIFTIYSNYYARNICVK